MVSRRVAASRYLLVLVSLWGSVISAGGGLPGEAAEVGREEDERLLREIVLPSDPRRRPDEQYFDRFVIRTQQGQAFVGAPWRKQGSFVLQAVDIFAVERTPKGLVGRRVHTEGLGADVLALHVIDLDSDGRDDLLFVHNTGGNIVTTGLTVLRQTPSGFSKIFFYAGTDVLVYRDRGQVRILFKARTDKEVKEFTWNSSKKTFEATRTFELLY